MANTSRTPQIFGSIQPPPGELTVLATMAPDKNAYGNIFVANVNDLVVDKVRIAIKRAADLLDDANYILYDTPVDPNFSVQIAYVGLDAGDQILGFSEFGLITFNMTGEMLNN